jgi:hypothetical protein
MKERLEGNALIFFYKIHLLRRWLFKKLNTCITVTFSNVPASIGLGNTLV